MAKKSAAKSAMKKTAATSKAAKPAARMKDLPAKDAKSVKGGAVLRRKAYAR